MIELQKFILWKFIFPFFIFITYSSHTHASMEKICKQHAEIDGQKKCTDWGDQPVFGDQVISDDRVCFQEGNKNLDACFSVVQFANACATNYLALRNGKNYKKKLKNICIEKGLAYLDKPAALECLKLLKEIGKTPSFTKLLERVIETGLVIHKINNIGKIKRKESEYLDDLLNRMDDTKSANKKYYTDLEINNAASDLENTLEIWDNLDSCYVTIKQIQLALQSK